jgi:hypothetical protein
MSKIKDLKQELVQILTNALTIVIEPETEEDEATTILPVLIETKLFPKDKGTEDLQDQEASLAEAIIYITYAGTSFGEKTGSRYSPDRFFRLFIYSKNIDDSETDVELMLEKCINALYKARYELVEDSLEPLKLDNQHFFKGQIIIYKKDIYS